MEYCIYEGPKTHKLWLSQFALIAGLLDAKKEQDAKKRKLAHDTGSAQRSCRGISASWPACVELKETESEWPRYLSELRVHADYRKVFVATPSSNSSAEEAGAAVTEVRSQRPGGLA